jgi:hypothetical protein
MDRWWWLEIEGGAMRQSYRFQKERFPSWDSVLAVVTDEWLESVKESFNRMYTDWSAQLSKQS